jgi:hypothetical protein
MNKERRNMKAVILGKAGNSRLDFVALLIISAKGGL